MENIFVTSDLHFFDEAILRLENRPFCTVDEMNSVLIANWNKSVDKNDTVYVLGDVCGISPFQKCLLQKTIASLKGHKVLVLGNHDEEVGVEFWRDVGFDEVYRHPIILRNYIVLSHRPPEYILKYTPYMYIYGHVHSTSMYPTTCHNSACVCVERWGYAPVELDTLISKMKGVINDANSGLSGQF